MGVCLCSVGDLFDLDRLPFLLQSVLHECSVCCVLAISCSASFLLFALTRFRICRYPSAEVCAMQWRGTETGDQRGVNGSRSKFLRNLKRRPMSQNHYKPSRVLGEVWNSYGRAKPTQNTPRTCERKHGSERENLQTWQTQTGQTAYSDRSDRSGWN